MASFWSGTGILATALLVGVGCGSVPVDDVFDSSIAPDSGGSATMDSSSTPFAGKRTDDIKGLWDIDIYADENINPGDGAVVTDAPALVCTWDVVDDQYTASCESPEAVYPDAWTRNGSTACNVVGQRIVISGSIVANLSATVAEHTDFEGADCKVENLNEDIVTVPHGTTWEDVLDFVIQANWTVPAADLTGFWGPMNGVWTISFSNDGGSSELAGTGEFESKEDGDGPYSSANLEFPEARSGELDCEYDQVAFIESEVRADSILVLIGQEELVTSGDCSSTTLDPKEYFIRIEANKR